MAFTIFQPETTVSAADMNANFQHIGNGNWLPMGGTSMENTTGAYDLGSTVYRWNNVYCHTLNVSGYSNASTWNLVSSVTLSSTASSIEITGLNYNKIKVTLNAICDPHFSFKMLFNGDSTSNYSLRIRDNVAGVLGEYVETTVSGFWLQYDYHESITSIFDFLIYAPVGYVRTMVFNGAVYATSTILEEFHGLGIYNNTINTITSIKYYYYIGTATSSFRTGTSIKIWSHA